MDELELLWLVAHTVEQPSMDAAGAAQGFGQPLMIDSGWSGAGCAPARVAVDDAWGWNCMTLWEHGLRQPMMDDMGLERRVLRSAVARRRAVLRC